jgi:uroporphyrinogen decarboxylase
VTSRERFLTALNHREPDRVPIDIGGSFATGINVAAYEALKEYLGVESEMVVASRRSQIAMVEEEIRQRLGIDTYPILPRAPEGAEILYPDGSYRDEWSVLRNKPEGGHYYVVEPPLAGDIGLADVEAFPWPDPDDPSYVRGLAEEAQALRQETDYAIVLSFPVGFIHQAQFTRGYEAWLMDLLLDPALAEAIMDHVLEIHLSIIGRMLEAVGDNIDVVLYADDVGFQEQTMVSPELYRKSLKPRQARLFEFVKKHTEAKILYHTCGAVYPLIGDFIDIGLDILNPIQTTARGMDIQRLKEEFGHDLCFWGGIDVQHLLPRGSPAEVFAATQKIIACLGAGGGYVLSAANNIQADTPPENIWSMVKAAHRPWHSEGTDPHQGASGLTIQPVDQALIVSGGAI